MNALTRVCQGGIAGQAGRDRLQPAPKPRPADDQSGVNDIQNPCPAGWPPRRRSAQRRAAAGPEPLRPHRQSHPRRTATATHSRTGLMSAGPAARLLHETWHVLGLHPTGPQRHRGGAQEPRATYAVGPVARWGGWSGWSIRASRKRAAAAPSAPWSHRTTEMGGVWNSASSLSAPATTETSCPSSNALRQRRPLVSGVCGPSVCEVRRRVAGGSSVAAGWSGA